MPYSLPFSRTEGTPRDLDPILCAGSADLRALRASAELRKMTFAILLLNIILFPPDFQQIITDELRKPSNRKIKFSSDRYQSHFDDLEAWGLVSRSPPEKIRHFSSYFSVPKNETHDRAIFNGRALSERTKIPPGVNLPEIPEVIRKINSLAEPNGVTILSGDLRHWFHQLSMSEDNRRYFGLAYQGNTGIESFVWNTLAMGWSWSPSIAQGVGWVFLTHYEPGEFNYLKMSPEHSKVSPTFVPLINKNLREVGFITLYYDNFLVVVNDPDVGRAMEKRILRNSRIFGVVIKEMQLHTRESLLNGSAVFLGLELGLMNSAAPLTTRDTRRMENGYRLRWRLHKDLTVGRTMVTKLPLSTYSPQEISATIGVIMYHHLVSLKPLGMSHNVDTILTLLSRLSKVAWQNGWRSRCMSLTKAESLALKREWQSVQCRPWFSRPLSRPHTPIPTVVTDASLTGWGYIRTDPLMNPVLQDHHARPFPKSLEGSHIFFLELYAAIQGITVFPKGSCVRVVVDNSAVAGALKRGWSTNTKAREMMRPLFKAGYELIVVLIPSDANIADPASRGLPYESARTELLRTALSANADGSKVMSESSYRRDPLTKQGVRHPEPEESQDDETADWIEELLEDPISVQVAAPESPLLAA